MNCESLDAPADDFAFPDVDSDPNLESDLPQGISYHEREANGSARAIKHKKEAIPGSVDLAASACLQVLSYELMVVQKQGAPDPVSDLLERLGRANDVGEDQGEQNAFGLVRLIWHQLVTRTLGRMGDGWEPSRPRRSVGSEAVGTTAPTAFFRLRVRSSEQDLLASAGSWLAVRRNGGVHGSVAVGESVPTIFSFGGDQCPWAVAIAS